MRSTMQERLTGMIRGGLAATLASTLMVPTTALAAQTQDDAAAQTAASQTTQAQSAVSGSDETADVGEDAANSESPDVAALLTPMGGTNDDSAGEGGSGSHLLDGIAQDPNEKVTIIVQLEDGGTQGISLFSNLLGRAQQDRHAYFKDCIRELAGQQTATDDNGGIQLFSMQSADDSIQELHDYYHVIDGFAIKAPAGVLQSIKDMDGVKNAFLGQTFSVPEDEGEQEGVANQSSLDMTAADQVDEKGDGQTVAIIDSGVATAHEAFSGDLDDSIVALTKSDVEGAMGGMVAGGQNGTYVSEKIPFAYDYADYDDEVAPNSSDLEHGTHVAGIAAANAGEIRGTAPNSQIIAMKVASDATGGIPNDAILAALDDCAVLNPDAINMSLGTDAGFSDESSSTFSDALRALEDQGVTINVAAGNAYSAALGNQSGQSKPYASDPDSGIVSSPSSLTSSLSVASVNNSQAKSAFKASDGTVIPYNLMQIQRNGQNSGETSPDLSTIADGEYELVDLGYGTAAECNAWGEAHSWDMTGKIAFIQRGKASTADSDVSFTEKVQNALAAGGMGWPAAIIIYNDGSGELSNAAVSDMNLSYPVICISGDDGQLLKNTENKTITVQAGLKAEPSIDYKMSDFSSWGVTPDLQLKPEITAPGGNIYSSILDGRYEYMSGTSMATPQMTGISALMHEYVEKDAKFANMSDSERNQVVTQLLMSTAKPLANSAVENGYVSPRKQGAGLANVPAATSSDVYATVECATDASRPKADLGESASGQWTFTMTLHNLGNQERTFDAQGVALSEQVANGLFQLQSDNWTGKGIDVSFGGAAYDAANGKVTVPANGTASCTVTVNCGSAFASWAAANTPNGTFVDGFAMLKSADGGVDLSVPYLGFYGDWSKANVFDGQLIDSDDSAADAADESADDAASEPNYHIYGTTNADPNGLPLGVNLLDSTAAALVQAGDYSKVDPNKMVVSNMGYDSAPSQFIPLTGLLRGVGNLTYTYKNEEGETVREYSHDFASKSYYYASGGYVVPTDARIGYYSAFDGKDDQGQRLPDGKYTLERTAATVGPGGEAQTDEAATFYYDTTGPQISDIEYAGEGDEATVSFKVTDDSWLAAFDFHDPITGGYFYRINPNDDTMVTNVDGSHTWSFTVKVADIKAAWDKAEAQIGGSDPCPNTVPLYAWDYGLNPSHSQSIVVTPIAAESIALDSTELALAPGQETQLTATVMPKDSTEKNLVWSSSDESVATVDQEGNVVAVANGSATITAASAINPEVKAEAKVTVAAVSEEAGIVMARKDASVAPGETVELTALLADSLQGKNVTWTSDKPDIATVEPNADNSTKATVSAGENIGDATITASVEGSDGKTHSAAMTVQVRPANYGEFVIDEATGTLMGYAGNSSYVEIPNNVKRINDQAFVSTPVQEVHVPTSVESIGYQAFANCSKLQTVTFEDTVEHPSQLREVGEQAFCYTLKLDTVKLPQSVTKVGSGVFSTSAVRTVDFGGATVIPDNALMTASRAYDVTVSDKVTSIGNSAFSACLSLGELKLSNVEGVEDDATKGLPSSLKTIGDRAFSGTVLSGNLVLPANVTSIGSEAFAFTGLTGVELPDGVKHLGAGFLGGTGITELTVPESVDDVEQGAFSSMGSLAKINLPSNIPDDALVRGFVGDTSLREIAVPENCKFYSVRDNVLFSKDGSKLVAYPLAVGGAYAVPEGVTEVADYAFCKSATNQVTFPSTLKKVGVSAFAESQLTGDVVLPDGLESIGGGAFMNLQIASANIGGAVTIGGSAFYSCPQLASVDLRTDLNRLQSVGALAFAMSSAIEEVNMPDSLTTLGDGAFENISGLKRVHIGAGLTGNISMFVSGAKQLSELTVSENNPVYSADNNVLYGELTYENGEKDSYGNELISGKHLVLSLVTNTFTEYSVAPGTVQIDAQAFRDNTSLQKVVLPEGLKRINSGAFNNCSSLADVNFPDSLEYVDGFVQTSLDVVDFGPNVRVFSDSTFMGQNPNHLIVRGMVGDGVYEDSLDWSGAVPASAYFGPGVKSVTFSQATPRAIVLPSTLESLSIDGMGFAGDTAQDTAANAAGLYVYAPAGTPLKLAKSALTTELESMKNNDFAWMGQLPADFDVDAWVKGHVKEYAPLAVELTNAQATVPGTTVQVTAAAVGGTDGAKQFRFFQQNADGTETLLADWSDANVINWQVPTDGMSLRAEVRDATTMLTESDTIGEVSAPKLVRDLDNKPVTVVEGTQGPLLAVSASAAADEKLTYQWYCDGAAVPGANQASFAPEVQSGEHTYYVVLTSSANGASAMVKSSEVVVRGVAVAQAPVIKADVPAETETVVGKSVDLAVTAESSDGGVLTYQWYRDGEAIEGATNATYTVEAAEVGEHEYSIEVTNTLAVESNAVTVKSGNAKVTVRADKAALTQAVTEVKAAVEGLSESDYTPESWKALTDAVAAADAVLANENAMQDEVGTATDVLTAAYKNLAKAETPGGNGGSGDNGNTGDNGGAGNGSNGGAAGNAGATGNGSAAGSATGKAASASGSMAQTGDMAPVAPIVGGGLLAALGAIISAAALRLRKRNQR